MNNMDKTLELLFELRDNISDEHISSAQAVSKLNDIENSLTDKTVAAANGSSEPLKSIMITFNIHNYSDMTMLFAIKNSYVTIIEKTGDRKLCNNIEQFLMDDPFFFRGIERLETGGRYYRLFFESMTIADTVYTVMSLTLSYNFRSTRFHILCDILLDYILNAKTEKKGLFNDFFDDKMIEFTQFLTSSGKHEPVVFLFRYEYISEFFNRIGLSTIIEMSREIKNRLKELFGDEVSIITISLSSYIVITSKENKNSNFEKITSKKRIDFAFKGIVLPYTVIQVPYKKDNSVYDIFENVYLLNNHIRNGEVRI